MDEWGNVAFIKEAINYRVVEKLGKKISEPAYGLSGDVGFLMNGKKMKKCVIEGDLSKCYRLGKMTVMSGIVLIVCFVVAVAIMIVLISKFGVHPMSFWLVIPEIHDMPD